MSKFVLNFFMKKLPINTSDIQGTTRILTDATLSIVDLVEDVHKRIVHPSFLPTTPIQQIITGISSISFKSIKLGVKFLGGGLDKTLDYLTPISGQGDSSNEKEAAISILNGVVGDYLEKSKNPLSIPMHFRYRGRKVTLEAESIKKIDTKINGKILLMVHGLCMNDLKWSHKGHNHGEELAKALNMTPIYLNYNSGRHISTNGQNLNSLLEQLLSVWPIPVKELIILTHSMGGLVTRSAMHYGNKEKSTWTKWLKKVVFLGTPHYGAPLEQAGNYLDFLLEATPWTKPFVRLSKIRSAGITDLRYGNIIDEDWKGIDRFEKRSDERTTVSLPKNVACYSIAAIRGKESDNFSNRLIGDGLVPLKSALGEHKDPNKSLSFMTNNTAIFPESNHMDLLSKIAVFEKLKTWLS